MPINVTSSAALPGPVTAAPKTTAAVPAAPASAASAVRAADGDYKIRSAATSQVKDADGDYKPVASAAAATSSTAVMAAVVALTKGG